MRQNIVGEYMEEEASVPHGDCETQRQEGKKTPGTYVPLSRPHLLGW